jgi:hypothetical protein
MSKRASTRKKKQGDRRPKDSQLTAKTPRLAVQRRSVYPPTHHHHNEVRASYRTQGIVSCLCNTSYKSSPSSLLRLFIIFHNQY